MYNQTMWNRLYLDRLCDSSDMSSWALATEALDRKDKVKINKDCWILWGRRIRSTTPSLSPERSEVWNCSAGGFGANQFRYWEICPDAALPYALIAHNVMT